MTKRIRNRVALTAFLLAPVVVVAVLVASIFIANRRDPAMRGDTAGQGAGDTGGANALGEWLAGRDPDAIQRRNRELRQGEVIRASDATGPITIAVAGVSETAATVTVVLVEGRDTPRELPAARVPGGPWVVTLEPGTLRRTTRLRLMIDGDLGVERDFPLLPAAERDAAAPVVVIEAARP